MTSDVGYPLVFGLVAVESMGVPVPGETALVAAAVLASRGHLSIELVIALAAIGAILGDNVGYLIGLKGGRRLLERPGRFAAQRRRVLSVGEPFFERHGAKAVFLGRFTAGLRIWAAWLAGATRMRWPRFLFFNATGGIAWALVVGLLAFYLGHGAETVIKAAGLAGGGAVIAIGVVAYLVIHRRQRRGEAAPDPPNVRRDPL